MLSIRHTVTKAFASQAAVRQGTFRRPIALFSTSSQKSVEGSSGSNSPSQSPRMQDKDQVQAEQQAKDPQKMANLGQESNRSKPEDVTGGLHTPGVKGKSRDDESLGKAAKNKASG